MVTIDLAWVEKLRGDFLTLLKNLPRVKNYAIGAELREAFRLFKARFHAELFEHFLKDLHRSDTISEADAKWIQKDLQRIAWDFYLELGHMPLGFPNDGRGEEDLFKQFVEDSPKWKERLQRIGQKLWTTLRGIVTWAERQQTTLTSDVPVDEKLVLEGFQVTVRGFEHSEINNDSLEKLKAGLQLFRRRAGQVAPILIKRLVPVTLDFRAGLGKGGSYAKGQITFSTSSLISEQVSWVPHVLAHEMGHHLWRTYLPGSATTLWNMIIRGDFGELDVREALIKWPGTAWAYQLHEVMNDPVLALQIAGVSEAESKPYGDLQTKEDFEALLDRGITKIRVPQTPITAYANKNPEEAFCEVLGLLVSKGPGAVHERARWWLETVMPGAVKVATIARAVVARILGRDPE